MTFNYDSKYVQPYSKWNYKTSEANTNSKKNILTFRESILKFSDGWGNHKHQIFSVTLCTT